MVGTPLSDQPLGAIVGWCWLVLVLVLVIFLLVIFLLVIFLLVVFSTKAPIERILNFIVPDGDILRIL